MWVLCLYDGVWVCLFSKGFKIHWVLCKIGSSFIRGGCNFTMTENIDPEFFVTSRDGTKGP